MEEPNEKAPVSSVRLPYEAPAIEETGQFEHLVLACYKSLTQPSQTCEDFGLVS